jgi:hypothetical protein
VIGLAILILVVYWFTYFRPAWRDGRNREINEIKAYVDYIRNRHRN